MKMIGHRGETFFDGPFIWNGKIHPLDERFMAKSDNQNTFGDFSKKIKLDPSRRNLKPVDPALTFEQYLAQAIKEGEALLAAEAKTPGSVTKENSGKPPILEDALAKMSDNPYVKARIQVLQKMKPEAKVIIEKMERGELPKDSRWDTFSKAITALGDKLSKSN